MNHALLAGSELDERAEILDADYLALEDLAFLKICGDHLDHLHSLVHHHLVGSAYGYLAVIGNIDLNPGAGNDLIDGLASLSHHIADLLRIDLNGDDLGRIGPYLRTGSGNGAVW